VQIMSKREDIAGKKFGRLTALRFIRINLSGNSFWEFECECGNIVTKLASNVKNGNTSSCGCLQKEVTSAVHRTHGLSGNELTDTWYNMNKRCNNPKDAHYKNYGGRGIVVCERWHANNPKGLSNFIEDMLPIYIEGFTINRIDVDGSYEKSNCEWVDWSTQQHEKRKRKNCSSNFIGVCFHKTVNKWVATIQDRGHPRYLGTFEDEQDAALAYDTASEQLYGDRPNEKLGYFNKENE